MECPETNRARDILNLISSNFVEKGLNDKNEKFNNSVVFINEQLFKIENELDNSEFNLEKFKKDNGFVNLPDESALLFSDKNLLEHTLQEMEIMQSRIRKLLMYIETQDDFSNLAPSTMGITDPLLIPMIENVKTSYIEFN